MKFPARVCVLVILATISFCSCWMELQPSKEDMRPWARDLHLARQKAAEGDLQAAKIFYLGAIGKAQSMDNIEAEAELFQEYALLSLSRNDYATAVVSLKQALEIWSKPEVKAKRALALTFLAEAYLGLQMAPAARKVLGEAEILAEETDNDQAAAQILRIYGIIAYHDGNWAQAAEHFSEAVEKNRDIPDLVSLADNLYNLGLTREEAGNLQAAERRYLEALDIDKQLGDRLGIYYSLKRLAELYKKRDNWAEAETYYLRAWGVSEGLPVRAAAAADLEALADRQTASGHEEKALLKLVKLLAYYQRADNEQAIGRVQGKIGKLSREKNKVSSPPAP